MKTDFPSHNCLTQKRSWCSHTSLMEISTSTAASKHSEEMCTYLGLIPQQPLASSCTPQPTRTTRTTKFLCLIPYLKMPLVTGNCWRDRKPGSLDGMENTGNILWVLRPPQPCRAEVSHPFSIHTSVPRLTLLIPWNSSLREPHRATFPIKPRNRFKAILGILRDTTRRFQEVWALSWVLTDVSESPCSLPFSAESL